MDEEPSEDIARDYLMDEAGKVKKRTPWDLDDRNYDDCDNADNRHNFLSSYICVQSHSSLVGVVLGYRLDGQTLIPGKGKSYFSSP
jgi:hypothetical protein